ncbi:glycosyltransferase [Butyrivibrio sp. XBB1001]|uniref:glycosyltransferase n=1 Tax=Butyrivibrio sp. XBB1001 TaxID=1280682 RepID=UPI00047D6C29|nr:glycosyltransferase [Butyrivibrio sp. XBB1001]
MKVLMVNKFLYPNGGSETYIFKLGEALEKAGHEVQYFGMEHEGRCVGNSVDAYTSDMDFHGGSKISKLTYPLKTIYSSEARKKIRQVLDDFKPDVVHLNNFNYQLTPSIILEIVKWREEYSKELSNSLESENKTDLNWNGCKIVFTAHDYQLLCPNHMFNIPSTGHNCEKCIGGRFSNCIKNKCIHGSTAKSVVGAMEGYFWKWKGVYKHIDKIICCSEFMKSKMDMNPVFAGKTVAMHNFVEHVSEVDCAKAAENNNPGSGFKGAESFSSGNSVTLSDGTKLPSQYVLYFGRYSLEKGIRTMIEACGMLPEVDFVFAGKGDYAEDIRKLPYAQEVGFRTGEDLDKLIRNAVCTVYPSEWYENNPFSVMESQERLVPVIGANIGGIPELIRDDVDGILFESGNAKKLADAIKSLWDASETVRRFRQNLRDVRSSRMDVGQYCKWIVEKVYT